MSLKPETQRHFVLVVNLMLLAVARSLIAQRPASLRALHPTFLKQDLLFLQSKQGTFPSRSRTATPTMSTATAAATEERGVDETAITTTAKIVTDLHACASRLRNGGLVAFPTETVYGLGCHALDPTAVAKVFAAKERPLTDPLIVHVLTPDDAFGLWKADRHGSTPEGRILDRLTQQFWPGPLTLVAQANVNVVPDTIMAGTGYCACRSPSHTTARALLEASKLPLAAPSANKFGHVSPTTAQHVWDDLQNEDVWILQQQQQEVDTTCCQVGVESTVAKLEMISEGLVVTVLRQGAVSLQDLQTALADHPNVSIQANLKRATKDHVANVAPGQTIRHYSPNIPSYLLSPQCISSTTTAQDAVLLRKAVVIDYGRRLVQWQGTAVAYRDLTPIGDSAQAAQAIFETLRWAEQVPQADCILFPDLTSMARDALSLAVQDRLNRAASGMVVDRLSAIPVKQQPAGQ